MDAHAPTRCAALTVLGRVAVRRGQPDAGPLLSQAWELAGEVGELQRTGPAAAGLAEAAWLDGDHARVRDIVAPVYAEAIRLGDPPHEAELGYWLAKVGEPVAGPPSGHPYALQAAGRWRAAAAAWAAAGCRYEHAAALADSPEPDDLLAALGTWTNWPPPRWPPWSAAGCARWACRASRAARWGRPGPTRRA